MVLYYTLTKSWQILCSACKQQDGGMQKNEWYLSGQPRIISRKIVYFGCDPWPGMPGLTCGAGQTPASDDAPGPACP